VKKNQSTKERRKRKEGKGKKEKERRKRKEGKGKKEKERRKRKRRDQPPPTYHLVLRLRTHIQNMVLSRAPAQGPGPFALGACQAARA
jgi:hypothetical protein